MLYRVIKEDTSSLTKKIKVNINGKIVENGHYSTLYPGLYKRLLFEDDDIVWIYLIQDGNYDADSFKYMTDCDSKALETLYQESEIRLKALNRDKQIDSILK